LSETRLAGPWHEAGPDPEGLGAQTQVQARRLDLVPIELALGDQPSTVEKRRDCAVRQNSCFASHHVSLKVFEATKPNAGH